METETANKDQQPSEIDLALARAALYSALALGFRPPTEETIARLVSREGAAALAQAAAILDPNGEWNIGAACSGLTVLSSQLTAHSSLLILHQRLFGHTARGGIPPYETEYGAEALFQQPQEMGDLMGFYRAFGLTLNAREHERADHISCECEFASFLALKEAYALERDDRAMLEETSKATRLFLRDHLGRFAPAFAKKLKQAAGGGFYGALANLCASLVALECRRFSVPAGPTTLSLRPATDDRVPMACGNGTECAAMPGAVDPEEMEE